jgi:hypothetical protein
LEQTYMSTVDAENARSRNQINSLIKQLGIQSGQTFGRNILPQLQDSAAAAGQFTSSKAGLAEGIAGADLQNDLNLQIGGLLQSDLSRQDALREAALNRAMYGRDSELNRLLGERRFDLGLNQDMLNRSLSASSLYGDAQRSQLLPAGLMQDVGLARDARNQLTLEDQIQMFNAPRNAQVQNINEYASLLYGAPQFQQQYEAGKGSPIQGAVGGAASGYELGSKFGGYGGAIGAVGGGLLGLFGV